MLFHLIRAVSLIATIILATVVVSASCDAFWQGRFCENPTTEQPSELPLAIGTVIAFHDADEDFPELGIVAGYWWFFNTQSYRYYVMTSPAKANFQSAIRYGGAFTDVLPNEIYHIFGTVNIIQQE